MNPSAILLLAAALAAPASPAAPGGRLVVDAQGRRMRLPAEPERIVALAPNLVEILFALGAGDRIAGRTDGALHPAAAAALPSVGGMARPSLEAILALDPDLVLATTEGNRPEVAARLAERGVPVFTVDRDSTGMDGVWDSVLGTGRAVGADARAEEIVARGRARLDAARRASDGRRRPRVLLLVWTRPAVAAGPRTYLGDLLVAAGADNAAQALKSDWPRLGREGIVALRPEVIVVTDDMAGAPPPGLEDLRSLPGLRASVVRIPGDPILRPSPAALDALDALSAAVHSSGRGAAR